MTGDTTTKERLRSIEVIDDVSQLHPGDYLLVLSTIRDAVGVYLHSVIGTTIVVAETIEEFAVNRVRIIPAFTVIVIYRLIARSDLPYDFQVRLVGRANAIRQRVFRDRPRFGRMVVGDTETELSKKVKRKRKRRHSP